MATGTAIVTRSDAQVKADVLKELKWDTTVWERSDEDIAKAVRTVTNQLSVTASSLDPAKIKSEIEKALERQAERESPRITVSVQDGTVTLTGTVRSWGERSAVEQAASFAPGVQRIEDRTVVDPYQ